MVVFKILMMFLGVFFQLFAGIDGIWYTLKHLKTVGLKLKFVYKSEETILFTRKTYGIMCLIFGIIQLLIYIILFDTIITFHFLIITLIVIFFVAIPAIIVYIIYLIIFDKNGKRKKK